MTRRDRLRALLAVAVALLMALGAVGPAVATTPASQSHPELQRGPTSAGGVSPPPATGPAVDRPAGDVRVDSLSAAQRAAATAQASGDKVDVVFVIDDTGSMGNNINGVKENIRGFTQDIEEEGIDGRYALITFRRSPEIDQNFTSDPGEMEDALDDIRVGGGTEDNFDALKMATEMDFRDGATRVIVDITDEDADFGPGVSDLRMPEVKEFMKPYAAYVAVTEDPKGNCASPPTASCKDKRALAGSLETGSYVDLGQVDGNDEKDFGDILNVVTEIVTDVTAPEAIAGPDIEYVDHELSETTVRPGEPFYINSTVRNTGEIGGRYTALFQVDLSLADTKRGSLAPGVGKRLSVRTRLTEPGRHRVFVRHRYVGTVTVEGEPVDEQRFLEVREAFTTRIALEPGERYETVSVVHNTGPGEHEFHLNYSREGVVNTTLDETVTLEGGETRLVRHEREIPSDAESAVGVEKLNGEPVGNLSVGPSGGTFGGGLVYAYTVATPDGDDRYDLVMLLRNPGEEARSYTLRLVPPDADRRSFDRYQEDLITVERTVPAGEAVVVRRGVLRPDASTPFGEFTWQVNGVPARVVVTYGDLRDDSGSGSSGSGGS
jgi:hypothetical protein